MSYRRHRQRVLDRRPGAGVHCGGRPQHSSRRRPHDRSADVPHRRHPGRWSRCGGRRSRPRRSRCPRRRFRGPLRLRVGAVPLGFRVLRRARHDDVRRRPRPAQGIRRHLLRRRRLADRPGPHQPVGSAAEDLPELRPVGQPAPCRVPARHPEPAPHERRHRPQLGRRARELRGRVRRPGRSQLQQPWRRWRDRRPVRPVHRGRVRAHPAVRVRPGTHPDPEEGLQRHQEQRPAVRHGALGRRLQEGRRRLPRRRDRECARRRHGRQVRPRPRGSLRRRRVQPQRRHPLRPRQRPRGQPRPRRQRQPQPRASLPLHVRARPRICARHRREGDLQPRGCHRQRGPHARPLRTRRRGEGRPATPSRPPLATESAPETSAAPLRPRRSRRRSSSTC